jgi:DHA1 family multidrug resistance protein-like MFS transporter
MFVRGFPRGVPLTLVNILLMSLGFYALIPYLSYYVTHSLGWSAFLAGVLLMVRQMSQQGLTLFTGMFGDRIGYKRLLVAGMIVRGVGFTLFGLTDHTLGLFAAAAISGIGGALFEPTRDATLTALSNEQIRSRVFAARKMFAEMGLVLSAPLSVLLLQFDFHVLSIICGSIYFVAGAVSWLRMPDVQVQSKKLPFRSMWNTVRADRPFLLFVLIQSGYYFMMMQMFLTIPMQVVAITGDIRAVSVVNLILGGFVVLLQVPVTRRMARVDLITQMRIGLVCMATGLAVLGLAGGIPLFLAGFLLYAFGQLVMDPAGSEMTARMARREVTATYFGFASIALAVGGGLSQGVGGWLFQTGADSGVPALVFLVGGGIGLLALVGLGRLQGLQRSQATAAVTGGSV